MHTPYPPHPLVFFEEPQYPAFAPLQKSGSGLKRDWNACLVDPEDPNTLDWTEEDIRGRGKIVRIPIYFNSFNSNEGMAPRLNISPHECCHPLSFNQLHCLEETILLAEYEIDSVRFPPIRVRPVDIVSMLKRKISTLVEGAHVDSIRIMGGVASHIMCPTFPFNDLDILFNLSFEFKDRHRIFKQIRHQMCLVLHEILVQDNALELEAILRRDQLSHDQVSTFFPTVYFQKYVTVPPAHDKRAVESDDCWSLICLRNLHGRNLEFKFVRCSPEGVSLKRNFEFSSDSFQIVIDDVYLHRMEKISKRMRMRDHAVAPPVSALGESALSPTSPSASEPLPAENESDFEIDAGLKYQWLPPQQNILFPHVYVVCMYPDFEQALNHLNNRYVKIYRPEELRGGGLLKYAYLRQNHFVDDPSETQENLRLALNAMVCRFLITYQDSHAQWHIIIKYLETHYPKHVSQNLDRRVNYLIILLQILAQSSAAAIEQAKALYQVIKVMIDWIRNEMKEIQEAQAATSGEASDFWNQKYAPGAGPLPMQATAAGKLSHIIQNGQAFALQHFVPTPVGKGGTVLNPPPGKIALASHQNTNPNIHPHPTQSAVEYRPPYHSHPKHFNDPRIQTLTNAARYHSEPRRHTQNSEFEPGIMLTHQLPNTNHRHASATNGMQWEAWCQPGT